MRSLIHWLLYWNQLYRVRPWRALLQTIMSGLEAAPVLRRMLPAVPIVMFTLHDNTTLEREALSVGVSAVVTKAAGLKTRPRIC